MKIRQTWTFIDMVTASKYMKQRLLEIKGKFDRNGIVVWDFNTLLLSFHGSDKHRLHRIFQNLVKVI